MDKHTPGPWHYGGIENVYAYHQGPHGFLHSRVVALVPAAELEGGEDEQRANARLIAAAPETAAERDKLKEVNAELLAALRPLAFFSGSFRDVYDRDRLHEMFAVARAAISKAEGKS